MSAGPGLPKSTSSYTKGPKLIQRANQVPCSYDARECALWNMPADDQTSFFGFPKHALQRTAKQVAHCKAIANVRQPSSKLREREDTETQHLPARGKLQRWQMGQPIFII